MVIDIHSHITYGGEFTDFSKKLGREPFTLKTLIKRMDMEGIDKSLLLPLANPENTDCLAVAGNLECIKAARKYPDRIFTFCNIDPRSLLNHPNSNLDTLMKIYKSYGCLGIGEICANIPINSALAKNLFDHAGHEKLPLLFHLSAKKGNAYGLTDKIHLPGLEEVLKEFSNSVFIGHAPAFWNEIDGNILSHKRDDYQLGPIKKRGRLWKLLEKYPNLYADLSAKSGYNAVNRDPKVGYHFLQKFNKKVFFGTDRFRTEDEEIPQQKNFLDEGLKTRRLTKTAYDNIMYKNFNRIILKKEEM